VICISTHTEHGLHTAGVSQLLKLLSLLPLS